MRSRSGVMIVPVTASQTSGHLLPYTRKISPITRRAFLAESTDTTNAILYRKLFVQFKHIHWIHWRIANINYIKRLFELPVHGAIRRFIKTPNTKTVIFGQIHSSYSWSGGTVQSPLRLLGPSKFWAFPSICDRMSWIKSFLILRAYIAQRQLHRHLFMSLSTKIKHMTAQLSIPKLFSTFIRCDPVMCSHSYFISCSFKKVKRLIRHMCGNMTDAMRTHTLNFQQSPHRIHRANITCTEILPNFIMDNATEAQLYSLYIYWLTVLYSTKRHYRNCRLALGQGRFDVYAGVISSAFMTTPI